MRGHHDSGPAEYHNSESNNQKHLCHWWPLCQPESREDPRRFSAKSRNRPFGGRSSVGRSPSLNYANLICFVGQLVVECNHDVAGRGVILELPQDLVCLRVFCYRRLAKRAPVVVPHCAHPPQARCKRQIVALPGREEFGIKMKGRVAAAIVKMPRIRIGDGTRDARPPPCSAASGR
jgi:hypothetical protein